MSERDYAEEISSDEMSLFIENICRLEPYLHLQIPAIDELGKPKEDNANEQLLIIEKMGFFRMNGALFTVTSIEIIDDENLLAEPGSPEAEAYKSWIATLEPENLVLGGIHMVIEHFYRVASSPELSADYEETSSVAKTDGASGMAWNAFTKQHFNSIIPLLEKLGPQHIVLPDLE
jgi:hypothetical protein